MYEIQFGTWKKLGKWSLLWEREYLAVLNATYLDLKPEEKAAIKRMHEGASIREMFATKQGDMVKELQDTSKKAHHRFVGKNMNSTTAKRATIQTYVQLTKGVLVSMLPGSECLRLNIKKSKSNPPDKVAATDGGSLAALIVKDLLEKGKITQEYIDSFKTQQVETTLSTAASTVVVQTDIAPQLDTLQPPATTVDDDMDADDASHLVWDGALRYHDGDSCSEGLQRSNDDDEGNTLGPEQLCRDTTVAKILTNDNQVDDHNRTISQGDGNNGEKGEADGAEALLCSMGRHERDVCYGIGRDDATYFTSSYWKKYKYAPRLCATCKLAFKKVGTKNLVFICRNAENTKHPCMHALCASCHKSQFNSDNNGESNKTPSARISGRQQARNVTAV
jgi:hypothetical protein